VALVILAVIILMKKKQTHTDTSPAPRASAVGAPAGRDTDQIIKDNEEVDSSVSEDGNEKQSKKK